MISNRTVNEAEVEKFSDLAGEWWHESGVHRLLHEMTPHRVGFIKETVGKLSGKTVLDIGCGGGLLSEPLARLGAHVTGIDASQKAIDIATQHAQDQGLPIDYLCTSVEEMAQGAKKFDIVIASEVIEHVDHVPSFLAHCCQLTNTNGHLILSTLNRTWKSYLLAIAGAEYILRWVPQGTHDWSKFLMPSEIADWLRPHGFSLQSLRGLVYNPFEKRWKFSQDMGVNYILAAHRETR